MAAMTMAYPLKDKWAFNVLKPGQTIHATLVVASDRAWLEGIVVTEEAKPESNSLAPPESARTLWGKKCRTSRSSIRMESGFISISTAARPCC